MRVVNLLGVLCVVAATAYEQGTGSSGSKTESDTLQSEVVYTPHDLTNVFMVTRNRRSAGNDPGPQEDSENDDRNYGRVVYKPENRLTSDSAESLEELRRIAQNQRASEDDKTYGRVVLSPSDHVYYRDRHGNKKNSEDFDDDEKNYGKVIHSPSERTQPEIGEKFTELQRRRPHWPREDDNDQDNGHESGDLHPGKAKVTGSFEVLRNILRNNTKSPEDMEPWQRELNEKIENELKKESEDVESPDEELDPEQRKILAENTAALFNHIIKTENVWSGLKPLETDLKYTDWMDSMLDVTSYINNILPESSG